MKSPNILLSIVAAVTMTFGVSTSSVHAQGSCGGDNNGDGLVNGVDLAQVLTDWGACANAGLSISSVSPSFGSAAGGTAITIVGRNFTGATSVKIGGIAATSFVVASATSITAVSPIGSAGAKDVLVTTPAGTATLVGGFVLIAGSCPSPTWATVLEWVPNAAVVTNATLRAAITASGLPWRVLDNGTNIEMLLVPAGIFIMGCSASTQGDCGSDESPTHQVTLSAFYIGRYEVTQAQWTAKMGSNPSSHSGYSDSPTRPVNNVSWNMIASGSTSFMPLTGLRLPTEAEWEYAYRAATTTAFHSFPGYTSGTNDDTLLGNIAWYGDTQTHAVGGKYANALGIHDMSGNVWEWCQDWYGAYSSGSVTNPTGPTTGSPRLVRGGAYYYGSGRCRASWRGPEMPYIGNNDHGFRAARNP